MTKQWPQDYVQLGSNGKNPGSLVWVVLCCQTPVAGFHQISNTVPTFVRRRIGPDIGTKVLCPLPALTTTQPTLETLKAILHISWSLNRYYQIRGPVMCTWKIRDFLLLIHTVIRIGVQNLYFVFICLLSERRERRVHEAMISTHLPPHPCLATNKAM